MAQKHPDELKAQVIADRAMGGTYGEIAKKYDLPRGTVQRWTNEKPVNPVSLHENAQDDLGQLVYDYLKAGLLALTAQAREAAKPEVISGQGESLYLLHGVLADKVVLILRGLERGATDEPAPVTG